MADDDHQVHAYNCGFFLYELLLLRYYKKHTTKLGIGSHVEMISYVKDPAEPRQHRQTGFQMQEAIRPLSNFPFL